MTTSFLATTQPQIGRFSSTEDQQFIVPVSGAGMLVVPRTADFLVNKLICI